MGRDTSAAAGRFKSEDKETGGMDRFQTGDVVYARLGTFPVVGTVICRDETTVIQVVDIQVVEIERPLADLRPLRQFRDRDPVDRLRQDQR